MKKFLLLLFFGILPLSAFAADSYLVTNGNSEVITEHSVCNLVTNSAGQTIMVPTKSSGEWSSFRTTPPTGVTSVACDTTPAGYNFTNLTGQNLNTLVYSNIVTITGINTTTSVSISGAGSPQFQIAGGAWTTSGTITNGQTLRLRLTSANSGSTGRTATANVGGVTDDWTVTTTTTLHGDNHTNDQCTALGGTVITLDSKKVCRRSAGSCWSGWTKYKYYRVAKTCSAPGCGNSSPCTLAAGWFTSNASRTCYYSGAYTDEEGSGCTSGLACTQGSGVGVQYTACY